VQVTSVHTGLVLVPLQSHGETIQMKKVLSVTATVLIALSLAACAGVGKGKGKAPAPAPASAPVVYKG
jgi:hypothetical protein